MLLGLPGDLLGPDHTGLLPGRVDAHGFVADGHGLRLLAGRAARIAALLLAVLRPANLGNLNPLGLRPRITRTGISAGLILLRTLLLGTATLLPAVLL